MRGLSKVAAGLEAQQTNPIAADALVLDTMLERAFDCAQEVKSKQMALTLEQGERDAETEEAFFASILFQRDQVSSRLLPCLYGMFLAVAAVPMVYAQVAMYRDSQNESRLL